MAKINPPKRLIFSSQSIEYRTTGYGSGNLLDFNDVDYLNKVDETKFKKGIEGVEIISGIKGSVTGEDHNYLLMRPDASISDYVRPHIIDQWDASIKYNLNSYAYDSVTEIIYRSLIQDNTGNPLTDILSWEDTGQTLSSYIPAITELQSLVVPATTSTQGLTRLRKPIILSYNSATVVDYSSGSFDFDDGSDQAFVNSGSVNFATNGLNGLDTGAIAANTWYYFFGIYNPTTQISGVIASINNTTPTLPSGFTKKKYIGALRTNASSQIIDFVQFGNTFINRVARQIFNSTATPTTITTITNALPLGKCSAQVKLGLSVAGTGFSNFCIWGSEMPTPVLGTRAGQTVSVATNNGFGADSQGDVYTSNGNLFVVSTINSGGVSIREAHLLSYTIDI